MKRVSITEELTYGTALDRLTGANKPRPVSEKNAAPEYSPSRGAMIKLSVFLGSEEDAYLENLASMAKFSGGKKLSKTKLIEAMVRSFRNTKLDVRGVRTDEELLKRVTAQLR